MDKSRQKFGEETAKIEVGVDEEDMPESYACAVVAATIGECGICGWIRTNKDKKQDRKWQKEDERKQRKNAASDNSEEYEGNPINPNETGGKG